MIIIKQSLNDTPKKRKGNKKEDQIFQQNLMFIPNLYAKSFAETCSPE